MSLTDKPISERIPNKKHRLFIDEYFKQNLNGTKAYQTVYGCTYDAARANAPKLLAIACISEEIEYRLKQSAMSADEVLSRLAEQARGDIGDFLTFSSGVKLPVIDLEKAKKEGKLHLIKKLKYGDNNRVDFELHDSQSALVHLSKILGLLADRLEISGPNKGPILFQEAIVELPNESMED